MKEYQMRCPNLTLLTAMWGWFDGEGTAREGYKRLLQFERNKDHVLVLHEWESDAEADKARLDWMGQVRRYTRDDGNGLSNYWQLGGIGDETLRQAIDRLREAPKETVTVIMRPEEVK